MKVWRFTKVGLVGDLFGRERSKDTVTTVGYSVM